MMIDKLTLREIGEKRVVAELVGQLTATDRLLDGMGHDAGFVPFALSEDEILVVNTDRSGENLAHKLGLAGPEAVGDLAVSHAVSDIAAAGGNPRLLTVSLLLPENKTLDYAKGVMRGVQAAAERWDLVIASGDTKKNGSVALVVTVIGKAKRSSRLTRSGAKPGDVLVVTGHLGTMFTAALAHQRDCNIPFELSELLRSALINQRPPVALALAFSDNEIAHACTDISDGLVSAVYDLCNASDVGASLDLARVPVLEEVESFAKRHLGLERESLIAANGDWQFLYAMSPEAYERAVTIASTVGIQISAVGAFTADRSVSANDAAGVRRSLTRLENDGFSKVNGKGFFAMLADNPPILGDLI
ncbi:thiamine-phosphate kinase [Novosphingobium sp. ST904]|uniref:thiamine-phosphate kinase n=1 Tax=Novosphingobium sp. ST904 TaxID=1684385 RepID=UPI0006C8B435|nr:thiamine-phosphate kinase [Novosphingobium sp. ST904]KPH67121.1 hypothetical protein ADT71_02830 [Novosphingobium sp. ST904]TCM25085.1 thiamine-phosphate kinase [Novosphingobium sp. ST904]